MSSDEQHIRHDASDLACTRCRERKIKCTRERPQCSNCERDESATCTYQTPIKRVNHLKLLCTSVDELQDRLSAIERDVARIVEATMQGGFPIVSKQTSEDLRFANADDSNQDAIAESSRQAEELCLFHNEVESTDSYHGPLSLFALCNKFRLHVMTLDDSFRPGAPAYESLKRICYAAGVTEPFPASNDALTSPMLPKQQLLTAVEYFFRQVDHTTDLFVEKNVRANIEKVYACPTGQIDESWAVCFKAIFVMVLGMEFSPRAGIRSNGLFSGYALTLLPGRATLVNSSLLTTPRLVNVQTLILLSTVAQWLDPPGWSETLHKYACVLARMMGLHRIRAASLDDRPSDEAAERTKVLCALHIRDMFFCTIRGSVSWFLDFDCDVPEDGQVPYHDRMQLAQIQGQAYRLSNTASRHSREENARRRSAQKDIEQQLGDYAAAFAIFEAPAPYPSPLETQHRLVFLATRIVVFQMSRSKEHMEQIFADARSSCILLLTAYGQADLAMVDHYNTLCPHNSSVSSRDQPVSLGHTDGPPFADALDCFSLPAFFFLLESLVNSSEDDIARAADAELLQKVALCFSNAAASAQTNNYHRKLADIFGQLLEISHILSSGEKLHIATTSSASLPAQPVQVIAPPVQMSETSASLGSLLSQSSNMSSWDQWLSMPEAQAISTPSLTIALETPNTMTTFPTLLESSSNSDTVQCGGTVRKRRRTHDANADELESTFSDFDVSNEEIPFHLVS